MGEYQEQARDRKDYSGLKNVTEFRAIKSK